MIYVRGTRRSTLVSVVLVITLDVLLVVIAVTTYFGGSATTAAWTTGSSLPTRGTSSLTSARAGTPTGTRATSSEPSLSSRTHYHPLRVVPSPTAVQQSIDESMTQGSRGGTALLERAVAVSPMTSASFPAIDTADTSSASLFAMAFTQELLDIQFVSSTRSQLLAWAQFNDAPNSLGDMPESLGAKLLLTSLSTGRPSVPSVLQWQALATSRVTWNVSGLVVSVSPTWTQALSAGWEPVDPLMGIYDVSGALTISTPGHVAVVKSISFALTLGGALLHPGYGAVALDDWTVN